MTRLRGTVGSGGAGRHRDRRRVRRRIAVRALGAGTDVSGHLEPLGEASRLFTAASTSALPTAIAHGVTTERQAAAALAEITRDANRFPDWPTLWSLLIGTWNTSPAFANAEGAR
jgi:hypothetical protein